MSEGAGVVVSTRVTHTDASLEEIEAAAPDDEASLLETLLEKPGVSEALVLSTCHRVEVYIVATDRDTGERVLADAVAPGEAAVWAGHRDSLKHLLGVAAGLESAVLGEDQVLGQVKDAAETARHHEALGPILEPAVMKAVHVGEQARTETAINDGVVSLGSAAARYAARSTDLTDAMGLVVGAGEMARLAAEALSTTDGITHIVVANRTQERAELVADQLPVPAHGTDLADIETVISDAAVTITATASDTPVIGESELARAGDTLVIDLGRPRDVEREGAPDPVTIYDLDDIETLTEDTAHRRQAAAVTVEGMVENELDQLTDHLKRRRADDVIAAMYESADRVKRREVQTALSRLESHGDLTDEQRAAVSDLADALVSQLLAAPTRSLRDAAAEDDWETIHTALQLFDPDFEEGSPFDTTVPDSITVPESDTDDRD